jgi:hypothetical protein
VDRRSFRRSRPGVAHPPDRPFAVAFVQVDRPDALGQHLHREPEHARVARRFDDAVIGGQSADHESLDAARSKEMFEERRIRLSALGVAHAETGVPVPPIRALADDLAFDPELGVEGRSPRVVHAMDRPDPAIGREVGRVLRMPILRVRDERPSVARLLELCIGHRRHCSPPVTYRLPSGSAKSFWTSTIRSAVRSS